MAALIKGIPVVLYEKTPAGRDEFGAPVYSETPVTVENVLVTPVSTYDVGDSLHPDGKRAEYELCIPKGDAHVWEDSRVSFFGRDWRTVGFSQEYIERLVPLDWNRKVRVVRYG